MLQIWFMLILISKICLFQTQIDEKRCDAEMKEDGIQDILKFGIAFFWKESKC